MPIAVALLVGACGGQARPPIEEQGADRGEAGDTDRADAGADAEDDAGPTDDNREPLPRVVTTDTPDGLYTMRVDDSSELELPQGTSSPEVSGSAVEVFAIASFADSGKSAWEIRAVEAGESTIVATVDDQQHVWTVRVPADR